MKKIILPLIKLLIFWLLFFAVMRIFFMISYYYLLKAEEIPFLTILGVFPNSIYLDVATACYLMVFPSIILIVAAFANNQKINCVLKPYHLIVIAIYVLIVMGETGLYGEWKTKLSAKALAYLREPSEIFNSTSTFEFVKLILSFVIFTILGYYTYVKLIHPKEKKKKNASSIISTAIISPIVLLLLFLGIRGGIREIPISSSVSYYCNYNILNLTAVNSLYNLFESILNNDIGNDNQFQYMDKDEANQRVNVLHQTECDSTLSVLKVKKPNIVILLLESWSADLVESLGGEPGISPNFRNLEKDGLLFTNFYASGNRTQQAIGSVFSGIPALPLTTITSHPEKYPAYPSLFKELKKIGYHSSFYFGGQLNYGNIRSYLIYNDLDNIVEGQDITENFEKGKLGIHDSYMLPWYAKQLSSEKAPFFSTILTISSHSPYDNPKIEMDTDWEPQMEKKFIESAHYTDYSIKLFFEEAVKQPWYDSTLFVIVADHSHNTYRNHKLASFDYHKIPMLLYGEVLNDSLKGKQFDLVSGNTDIPATLLAQLGVTSDSFFWSKNIFNKCYKPFAFFELNNGFGWKTPQGSVVYQKEWGYDIVDLPSEIQDSVKKDGQAYIQSWVNEFLSY